MNFDQWLEKAVEVRDTLQAQQDHLEAGKPHWDPPAGMSEDEWKRAIKEQLDSLNGSLKNFGR